VIRHFFEIGTANRSRQLEPIFGLPSRVLETAIMRVLVIGAVASAGLNSRQLAALVVWAVAMATVAVPADHHPSATPGAEEHPIAIPSTRQATPLGGWTSHTAQAMMLVAIRHTAMSQRARGRKPRALTSAVA